MTVKISQATLTNRNVGFNKLKQNQITLYQPMRATKVDTIHGHAEYVPVDRHIIGFTSAEEAEKMLAIFRAKDPFGVYKVLDMNYQYADNYEQYKMYRNNDADMQHSSFNRGYFDDIKGGIFLATNPTGGFLGAYSNLPAAQTACRLNGCKKGEENIEVRKAFQTYAGYQRYITALKKRGEEITTR